jgi:uncharacterized protein (TIGR02996 family)
MSDSRPALFQAVLDRPDDDAPRLAYAGYCDAQGDPYGAFIRAQLACTEGLRYGNEDDAWSAWKEAQKILAQHKNGAAWKNGIENLVTETRFIRGFVDKVLVDAQHYLERADELYRRAPIRQLVLTNVGDLATAIAREPHLAQLSALTLSGKPPIGDAGLAAIATSPHLRHLRALHAPDQNIGIAGLEPLCASKTLPALIYVNLTGNRFEDPIEGYGTDWVTGRPDLNGAYLPPFGKELEAKYGELPWLHAPSRLRHFPPSEVEF